MKGVLELSGFDVQKALYLYKNESLADLNFISEKFGKEMVEYRINMSKSGIL